MRITNFKDAFLRRKKLRWKLSIGALYFYSKNQLRFTLCAIQQMNASAPRLLYALFQDRDNRVYSNTSGDEKQILIACWRLKEETSANSDPQFCIYFTLKGEKSIFATDQFPPTFSCIQAAGGCTERFTARRRSPVLANSVGEEQIEKPPTTSTPRMNTSSLGCLSMTSRDVKKYKWPTIDQPGSWTVP